MAIFLEELSDPPRNAIDHPRYGHDVIVTAETATVLRNNTQNLTNYLDNTNEAYLTRDYYRCCYLRRQAREPVDLRGAVQTLEHEIWHVPRVYGWKQDLILSAFE